MKFDRPTRRRTPESVVPMINVVFLLLIFFMMSARIAPTPPFDMTLPQATQDATQAEEESLYISAKGVVGYRGRFDQDAWGTLRSFDPSQKLTIRADANLPMPQLAKVMARLARIGIKSIDLALRTP